MHCKDCGRPTRRSNGLCDRCSIGETYLQGDTTPAKKLSTGLSTGVDKGVKVKGKELWGLHIGYNDARKYIGVYPSLEYTLGVVDELVRDLGIKDSTAKVKAEARAIFKEGHEDYFHLFSDDTWIVIQPIGQTLVKRIKEAWGVK